MRNPLSSCPMDVGHKVESLKLLCLLSSLYHKFLHGIMVGKLGLA
jgi:hypothetical protein